MASKYAKVNVYFGADIKQFSTAMQNAARDMKKAGQQLTDLGKSMTTNLTLPIAALGTAALYAFGQIDQLKRGLISITGSAEGAEEEFSKLREIAKLPGIGLEEAVRGSINLQAIGVNADKAREAMTAFGNAIATVGGGKENFDLAIRGFGQLYNASKPLQQDLYQIANQLPQINKLMLEAFGTNRAEDLAKLGMSGKQLAEFLITELGKLPKVSGGIKNAFENMSDSVKVSLAGLGEAIEKNFDISGKLGAIADFLTKLVTKFKELDPSIQKLILTVVGLVAVVGPLLLALGSLIKLFPLIIAGWAAIANSITMVRTAVIYMNTALAMSPAGFIAIIAAIGLAAISMGKFSDKTSETTKRLKEQREENAALEREKWRTEHPYKAAEIEQDYTKPRTKGMSYDDWRRTQPEKSSKGGYKYAGDDDFFEPLKKQKEKIKLTAEQIETFNKKQKEAWENNFKAQNDIALRIQSNESIVRALTQKNEEIIQVQGTGIEQIGTQITAGGNYWMTKWAKLTADMRRSLEELNATIRDSIANGISQTLFDSFSTIGENIGLGEDPFKNVGKVLLDSLGRLMKTIGAAMIAWGVNELLFEEGVITLNAPQAIAAGVAMAAAGAAISSAAKKGLKGASDSSEYGGGYGGSSRSGSGQLTLNTRVDGRDLQLSSERTTRVIRR